MSNDKPTAPDVCQHGRVRCSECAYVAQLEQECAELRATNAQLKENAAQLKAALAAEQHRTELAAQDMLRAEREHDRLRAALERIATTRCAWQLSQEIAREALK
jgi:hypothetical protein